jgi:glycosyltransferase involved in cell wall biosynthesis
MKVTLLTVGEHPGILDLHVSQVLSFGAYLRQIGVNVQWIAFLPVESRLKDLVSGVDRMSKIEGMAADSGVSLHIKAFPISISRIYSYLFPRWLVRQAGRELVKILREQEQSTETHIVHCRSYFATAVALEAKKQLENIRVSFDMRSLLPPEIPLRFPHAGKYLYGNLKRWEAELLELSDFSFLPCHRGIALLELEGISRLPTYMPIIGFEVIQQDTSLLSSILENPIIGYVGSFEVWHSARLLERIFDELAANLPACSFEVLTGSATNFKKTVRVRAVPNHEVKEIVKSMLAVVVPGSENFSDHFSAIKLSANFFSTKAAEALSLGVPLIVNARIRDLAEYVRTRGCGLVFSMKEDKVQFEGISSNQLSNLDLWNNLREAACRCAPEFRRSAVFEHYLKVWHEN